jgi:hypothetical protein
MNTQKKYKEDPIKRYFNPEMTEKAPEGFTEKVMTMVSLETRPVKAVSSQTQKNYVPVISVGVILILTIVAFTLPSSVNELTPMPWMKMIHNLQLPALKIDFDSLLNVRLPAYLPYALISLLFLSIFDRALNGIFHRDKKAKNF